MTNISSSRHNSILLTLQAVRSSQCTVRSCRSE